MKQTKIFWGFLLLIITLVTGCSKEDVGNNDTTTPPNTENKITLRASTGSDTRIGFEEATDKIKLTWKKADKFALYDATGALAATFVLTDGGGTANGTFNTENTLTDGESYTVCYPAIEDATTLAAWEDTMETRQSTGQTVDMSNSDPMAYLSDVFGMSQKDYTYDANNPASIKFSHHYAMLTLEIAKPANYTDTDVPTALRFVNGSTTTVVTLANFPDTWEDSETIKVYALILPSAGTKRTLSFSLDGESMDYVVGVSSSTAYEAGKRYTAELKDGNALVALTTGLYYRIDNGIKTLWDGDTFQNELTDNSTVLISTLGTTKIDSIDYRNLIISINRSSRSGLTLDFSRAMAEADAINNNYRGCSGIKAVSGFPVGITSLNTAFYNFDNLTSVAEIPNSVTDMKGTFYYCGSFNQPITIPNSVTNMNYTFRGCSSFNQPITIPNSVTNMFNAFRDCTALASTITIYGASSLITTGAFDGTNTANISLILDSTRENEWIGGNKWAGYIFNSIIWMGFKGTSGSSVLDPIKDDGSAW